MSTHPSASANKSCSNDFSRQIGLYSLAAAVAGVSMLALAEPAAAEVVVTRKTIPIPVLTGTAEPVRISLSNNGVTDLSFTLSQGALPGRSLDFNAPDRNNGVLVGGNFSPYAVALTRGASIGPVRSEARSFYFRGLVELSASSGVNKYCKGFWGSNPKYYLGAACGEHNNEYVGVSFQLNGQTHYGWVRLTVTTSPDPNGPPLTAKITGYAYETVANKPILAGTASNQAAEFEVPDNLQNQAGPSLGMLARGADALPMWRRK